MTEAIYELIDADTLMADERLWRVYEASFPVAEREPRTTIRRSLEDGRGLVFRARSGHETVGMAACQLLEGEHWLFLVYIAVSPELRGHRYGTELFEFVWRTARSRAPQLTGMVWEIDRVSEAIDARDAELRARRIRFFCERGGQLLTDRYLQPALDGHSIVPMHLAYRPALPLDVSAEALVRRLTDAIYFEKYQRVNGISRQHLEDLLAGRKPPAPAFEERDGTARR